MDVLDRRVVHGKSGNRKVYEDIPDSVCGSSDPLKVARFYHDTYGFQRIYVADLDAIEYGKREGEYLEKLSRDLNMRVILDAGVNDPTTAEFYLDAGVEKVIIGTETLDHLGQLHATTENVGAQNILVSVDLRGGQLLSRAREIQDSPLGKLFSELHSLELFEVIILTLDLVGTGQGTHLPRALEHLDPAFNLYLGGGLRDPQELEHLSSTRVAGVLAATIFYKGQISPEQVHPYLNP